MGLTQKEKEWILRVSNLVQKNNKYSIEIKNDRSGQRSIQFIVPHGEKIKDRLDTGRNNFNNKQRRVFSRLIDAMYFIIFMEKALPGISLMAKQLAIERLKIDKIVNEVN